MIEDAYLTGEAMGLPVWCTDQAGPFQTVPHPGPSWRPEGRPAGPPHEYLRDGTAKILTLFHPADGRVRLEGVTACPNTVLHGWLKRELTAVLAAMPAAASVASRSDWERWQGGLGIKPTDVLIGLPSTGLHTNGYSLARKLMFDVAGYKTNQ